MNEREYGWLIAALEDVTKETMNYELRHYLYGYIYQDITLNDALKQLESYGIYKNGAFLVRKNNIK